ncbi:hypothetical protein PAEVO_31120 [Paenibacillus sp. GM2FR]|uniref:hypothetical protein n=1 Tax=Paenibacillus sp. GM2FR TaxID=2059268 RepID=UPI000CA8DF90|nr:hypothetical protein [Paenibacillus sp. GM2FR]PJN56389.1 hypothetical protein PAEVO_31120 [Paenibacillus sp. GM2FR]
MYQEYTIMNRGDYGLKTLNYGSIISSLIIGISIVAASFILQGTEGSKSVPAVADEAYLVQSESPLMTLEQTAEFLNLTEYQVKNIISAENAVRGQGAAAGSRFPYIVVQNEIYISKMGLISWLEEATQERRVY